MYDKKYAILYINERIFEKITNRPFFTSTENLYLNECIFCLLLHLGFDVGWVQSLVFSTWDPYDIDLPFVPVHVVYHLEVGNYFLLLAIPMIKKRINEWQQHGGGWSPKPHPLCIPLLWLQAMTSTAYPWFVFGDITLPGTHV